MITNKCKILFTGILISLCLSYAGLGHAEVITLSVPIIDESPTLHLFFHELLDESLKESGFEAQLITPRLPQQRARQYLHNGLLSIYWMVETTERNENYIPIKVGLTNGLIGKRILLIPKGYQHFYDDVASLDDFRELNFTAGMGVNWFDTKVWFENDLSYKERPGNWETIFDMVAHGREYSYFPRGVNEVVEESKKYPLLEIEQRLVLVYERDFLFYLSKSGENAGLQYRGIIENSLRAAEKSGLIDRLVKKYWHDDFALLGYDKRLVIELKTPGGK